MGRRRSNTFSASHFQAGGFPRKVPSTTAYTPLTETDIVFAMDPDLESDGLLTTITDRSSGGHNLTGAGAERSTVTAAQFGAHKGFVFPDAAAHGGYLFTPWARPVSATIYQVVKYVSSGTYQALWVGNAAVGGVNLGPTCRVSNAVGDLHKASITTGANTAVTTAMADGSTHLIKYGWDFDSANKVYIALDGGAKVEANRDGNQGTFDELSLSSLDVQTCTSVLGIGCMFSAWHDGDAEDVRITNYLKTWAGIA